MTEAEGAVLRARPTIYNGIQMRSRLEARVAAWLDAERIAWEYEPNAFASPAGQYLPDFRLPAFTKSERFGGRDLYLEIKPTYQPDSVVALMGRMDIIRASLPTADLAIGFEPWLREGALLVRMSSLPWQSGIRLVRCPCGSLCIGDPWSQVNGRRVIHSVCLSCWDDAYRDEEYTDRYVRLPDWRGATDA